MGGVRPFGVALLVAGVEAEDMANTGESQSDGTEINVGRGRSRLYKLEPSGRYSAWKAAALGKGSAEAESILERECGDCLNRDRALKLALSVILRCAPTGTKPEAIDLAFIEIGNIQMVDTTKLTL